MDQKVREFVTGKVKELMDAPSCCKEAKEACQAWLDAAGTEHEKEASEKLIAELEEDIMPIDGLIAFAKSDMGAQIFGAEKARDVAAHAEEIKAAGAEYCDCAACAACEAVLKRKEEILA